MSVKYLKIISLIAVICCVGLLIFVSGERRIKPLTKYVNLNTDNLPAAVKSPDASWPFGVVQCGPDFGKHKPVRTYQTRGPVYGFGHLRPYCSRTLPHADVRLLPISGALKRDNSSMRRNERAAPGYYGVDLDSQQVHVDITVSPFSAMHRYSFPADRPAHVLIDVFSSSTDELSLTELKILSSKSAAGVVSLKNSLTDSVQQIFFFVQFSRTSVQSGLQYVTLDAERRTGQAFFSFDTLKKPLICKIGFSFNSINQAEMKIQNELQSRSFEYQMLQAHQTWNNVLNRIVVKDGLDQKKVLFYNALYCALSVPLEAMHEYPAFTEPYLNSKEMTGALLRLIAPDYFPDNCTIRKVDQYSALQRFRNKLSEMTENQVLSVLNDSLLFLENDSLIHIPYAFYSQDKPEATYQLVCSILEQFFADGNQISIQNAGTQTCAWLVWQMLGLYPIDADHFLVQPSAFADIRIHHKSATLIINAASRHAPIHNIFLNETQLAQPLISSRQLEVGGHLILE